MSKPIVDQDIIKTSLDYGESYCKQIDFQKIKDETSENFDFTDNFVTEDKDKLDFSEISKVLDYEIQTIKYSKNQTNIETLEIEYKNRNTSKCISLIKTKYPAKEELETFKLEDKELIINVIFYLDEKSNQLKGLSLKTNFGNVKLIGNDQNAKAVNETKINEGEENRIIGFGGYHSQKSGITSIYCYYIDKKKYGMIMYEGIFNLAIKLRADEGYKKELEKKIAESDKEKKFILDVCNLPNVTLYLVIKDLMDLI